MSVRSLTEYAVVPLVPNQGTVWLWAGLVTLAVLAAVLLSIRPLREASADLLRRHLRTVLGLLTVAVVAVLLFRNSRHAPVPAPSVPRTSVPAARPGPDWPMDRGGLARCGRVASATGPSAAHVRWRQAWGEEAWFASPCVVGNRVYCVASQGDRARIVCLDAASGQQVWSSAPPNYRATFSSPVVVDQLLLCGEGLHSTRRARLVALDLHSGREGTLLWTVPVASHVECTPVVWQHKVYFGAGDDGVYAFALRHSTTATAASPSSGPSPSPKLLFHLPGSRYPDVETALAVHAGRLYVGLGVGGQALCILDAVTGDEIHRIALDHPVFSPPAIDGTRLYVGLGGTNLTQPGTAVQGEVICVDLESRERVWTHPLPGTVLGAIALDGGELFWGCGDGRVYACRLADQRVRTYDTGAPLAASLAVTPATIFAVNTAGRLVALDRDTFRPRFSRSLGAPGHYVSAPVAFGDALVVGTPSAGLICIGGPTAAPP
ncbi:MAG: PQQ-binding-like beta-propeller repeat protein [Pirellulales bacterium]